MVPITRRTEARTAVWAEAATKLQTVVSFEETTESLDQTIQLDAVAGSPRSRARAGLVLGGRYRLEELLVRGGSTETWRAFDVLLARQVTVHLLPDDQSSHTLLAAAKRASVGADFRVLRVLDARSAATSDGPDDGWVGPYIVGEYATGKSLEDLLAAGPLSAREAAWVVREVADALTGMHARGLYHQRLSPGTVVITDSGNIKIAGFLVETETAPSHQTIRDPQEVDVKALGHLLHALLTSRWPGGSEDAITAPSSGSSGRILAPLDVQPSVPPSLDEICDRIVNPSGHGRAARLRTAADVSAALSRVLGTADAAQDLERRVQGAGVMGADRTLVHHVSQAYAETPPIQTALAETSSTLRTSPAPLTPKRRTPKATRTPKRTRTPSATPAPARQPKQPARWRRVLVPLVLIAIVGSVVAVGLRLDPSSDAPGNQAQAQAAGPAQQWPVVAAKDFDPEGNGEERPKQVSLAWDGNPGTSWTTMNYFEGDIGNKSGVGLVFDLGEVRQVSRVELDLDGNGTSLEVRIPTADGVTTAPLGGVDQWRPVGTADRTPAATAISLQQPVQTRYVLVYLTEVPPAGGQFTGGIAEARFWG